MNELPGYGTSIVAVDLETSGLHPFYSEIVEIGAVRFAINGKVIDEYSSLIKPLKPIPPDATAINGITNAMVSSAPYWTEKMPEFYDFIAGSLIIAHNAPFDLSFLQFYGMVNTCPFPDSFIADTLIISREIFPHFPKHALVELAGNLNIPTTGMHRSLADARACMEIFLKAFNAFGGLEKDWKPFAELYIFHTSDWQDSDHIDGELLPISDACREGRDIMLEYVDSRGVKTSRRITPVRLVRIRGVPYLIGHCHLRDASRNFRLDRIDSWEVL